MDYSKFYTPLDIANILVDELSMDIPVAAIDICCGGGNLLYSVQHRWSKTKLVGVDVSDVSLDKIKTFCCDGRKFALRRKKTFPLVVGNPPFAYLDKRREYPELYSEMKYFKTFSRLENEMMLANLKVVQNNGVLLIIMPSTFVEGESNKDFRKFLASKYSIKKIIRLPLDAFGTASIRCYAIYIQKSVSLDDPTTILELTKSPDHSYKINKNEDIKNEVIRSGNWETATDLKFDASELRNFEMKRGKISSQFFENTGVPVLHTSKCQAKWNPSVRYVAKLPSSVVTVNKGDVLVSRIGKSAGQWTVHTGKEMPITDCLFRIRDHDGKIASRLQNNRSLCAVRGVATRYITMKDFYMWYQSLETGTC